MRTTFRKLWDKPYWLAAVAGVFVFLAFEPFNLPFTIFLFPALFNNLTFHRHTPKHAFWLGFLTSFVLMIGGFYWVIYVLHEFGYLPWAVSTLLFLCFCGFGALNFPIFCAAGAAIHSKINWLKVSPTVTALWFAVGLPALFTLIEFLVPKLFPWYLGHCLYQQPHLIQIAELTGVTFLTFSLYSVGSVLCLHLFRPPEISRTPYWTWIIPIGIWVWIGLFGTITLIPSQAEEGTRLRVALIQPNIGSLEKVAAEKGVYSRLKYVVNQYKQLTQQSLAEKPDLIVWPETAMPFNLDQDGPSQRDLKNFFATLGVPIITGGYAQSPHRIWRDYNAAFLFEQGETQVYHKNILLAYGEYFPLGDTFPQLYKWFDQVSDFERGTEPGLFILKNGIRLGVSICYEAIVPSFMRRTANQHVRGLINLTNDSWFGPTSEPLLHGSLTVFRAVEHRLPMVRVTNTGVSFTVDKFGRRSRTTPVYDSAILVTDIVLPPQGPLTLYGEYGDWFAGVCAFFLLSFLFLFRRPDVPVPV